MGLVSTVHGGFAIWAAPLALQKSSSPNKPLTSRCRRTAGRGTRHSQRIILGLPDGRLLKVMSRLSVAGLLVASVLAVGAPLALDRIGKDSAAATFAGPGGDANPPPVSGGATTSPRRRTPDLVMAVGSCRIQFQRGTIIEPAQPVPPRPADAPFVQ